MLENQPLLLAHAGKHATCYIFAAGSCWLIILSKEYISWDLLERIYFIIILLQVQGTLLFFIAVQDRGMNNLSEVTLFVL